MNKVYILSLISICFAAHNAANAVWPFKSSETKVYEAVMESDIAKFGKSYPAVISNSDFNQLKPTLYQESTKRYEFRSNELNQAIANHVKRNWSKIGKGSLRFSAGVVGVGLVAGAATKSKNPESALLASAFLIPLAPFLFLSTALAAVTIGPAVYPIIVASAAIVPGKLALRGIKEIGYGFRYQKFLTDKKNSAKKIMDHLAPVSHN